MEQKKLQLSSIQLSYYESVGKGSPIILIHGNSASGLAFRKQINSPLGENYRIIAIDLPGHGDSGRFGDIQGYNLPGYAAIIAEATEVLGAQNGVFVGWSLGGHIILEAHKLLSGAIGFAIYGTPPIAFPPAMEEAFLPNPAMGVGFTPDVTNEQAQAYATSFFAPGTLIRETTFVSDILRTDSKARAGLAASIQPNGYQDEVKIVGQLSTPLAILHGSEEQLVSLNYINQLTIPSLWRGAVQVIEDSGHAPHWEKPDEFNSLLDAFVSEVTM